MKGRLKCAALCLIGSLPGLSTPLKTLTNMLIGRRPVTWRLTVMLSHSAASSGGMGRSLDGQTSLASVSPTSKPPHPRDSTVRTPAKGLSGTAIHEELYRRQGRRHRP
eukprot:831491-Pelagomonas_calceolata.AAC.4